MISTSDVKRCIKLANELKGGDFYQPLVLPGGTNIRRGHDREPMMPMILGKGSSPKSLLDVGCNIGHVCYLAKRAGVRNAVGVEKNQSVYKVLKIVGDAWGFSVVNSSLEDYEIPGDFDVIAMLSILHHRIDEPLEQIKRYANKATRFVIEVPVRKSDNVVIPAKLGYTYWRWLYCDKQLRKFLSKCGFRKVFSQLSPLKFHGGIPRRVFVGIR